MMTETQKLSIIASGKEYFREIIIPNHLNGLKKLQLKSFNINSFFFFIISLYPISDSGT